MSEHPNDPEMQYSVEYLQYADQLNRTTIGKQILENELSHQRQMQEIGLQTAELSVKNLEATLMAQREAMRPHKVQQAFVTYDAAEGRYRCALPDFSDPDEAGTEEHPVVAYGATPAQACDNFDHLWIHGEHNV